MSDVRRHYDPLSGVTYLVNVRTGQVRHAVTGEYPEESVIQRTLAAVRQRVRSTWTRSQRDEVRRSLGLVKVRGALGGTYWE